MVKYARFIILLYEKDKKEKILHGWYDEGLRLNHYVNDKLHNDNALAEIWNGGDKIWYQNDKCHRIDGPAAEYEDGKKAWYYQDKYVKCNSQKQFERNLKLKILW